MPEDREMTLSERRKLRLSRLGPTKAGLKEQEILLEMQALLHKIRTETHLHVKPVMWSDILHHFELAIDLLEFPRDLLEKESK
jgi:hypothetical protein